MIKEFLEKYQEDMNAHKIEIEEDYDLLLTKIKENEKFLQLLKDENDAVFMEFTPRDVNIKNKDRIEEIEKQLFDLQDEKEKIEKEINHTKKRIVEVQSIIHEMQRKSSVSETENNKYIDKEKIIKDLHNISGFIVLDPTRAKMEIDNLIKYLNEKDE